MKTTPHSNNTVNVGVVLFQSSARVESFGTVLASLPLQAKPAWAGVRLNKFLNAYS